MCLGLIREEMCPLLNTAAHRYSAWQNSLRSVAHKWNENGLRWEDKALGIDEPVVHEPGLVPRCMQAAPSRGSCCPVAQRSTERSPQKAAAFSGCSLQQPNSTGELLLSSCPPRRVKLILIASLACHRKLSNSLVSVVNEPMPLNALWKT